MSDVIYHSIAYSYNIADTINHFNSCNLDEKKAIEMHIAKVIVESFVEPADDDYLAARSLAIGGLHRLFYWSAAQAVEKYLKAFLVLHGVSVENISHNLNTLLNSATKCEAGFSDIDISPHRDLSPPAQFPLSQPNLSEFILLLERFGSPNNRYNNYGAIYDTGHLFALDSIAYRLRNKMQVPRIEASFRRRLSADFQRYLYEHNPYFAPAEFTHAELPNPLFPLSVGEHVPHWEFLQKSDTKIFRFSKQWLKKHMKISF